MTVGARLTQLEGADITSLTMAQATMADAIPPLDPDDWWAEVRNGTIYADPLVLSRQFLQRVQSTVAPPPPECDSGWLRLPDRPGQQTTWEHASWLRSSDLTNGLLRDVVDPT